MKDNNDLITALDWTDEELSHEFGYTYHCVKAILKEAYESGEPNWITLSELKKKMKEEHPNPYVFDSIWDQNKVKTILDNASWSVSHPAFYCWKPSFISQDVADIKRDGGSKEQAVSEEISNQMIMAPELEIDSKDTYLKESEIANNNRTRIEDLYFSFNENDVIENKTEPAQNSSLEECIKMILIQNKSSGREWITALDVYDTLRKLFPSVAESSEFIDIRDILTTSNWIEKDDFHFRISGSAFANADLGTQIETKKLSPEVSFNTKYNEGPNNDTCNSLEVFIPDGYTGADPKKSDSETSINTVDEYDTYKVDVSDQTMSKNEDTEPETLADDASQERIKAVEDIPIEELESSVRACNCPKSAEINTIGDPVRSTSDELFRIRDLEGKNSRIRRNRINDFLLHSNEDEVIENEPEQAQNSSLEECIRMILIQCKYSGREWITALGIYDTLRKLYPSVAESSELEDIREVLASFIGLEKDGFFYILSGNAFSDVNRSTHAEIKGISKESFSNTKNNEGSNAETCNSLEVIIPDGYAGADPNRSDPETSIGAIDEYDTYKVDVSDQTITKKEDKEPETPANDASTERIEAVKGIPIERLGLSARPYHCLKWAGIRNVSDILYWDFDDFLKLRNIGKKSANEILRKIEELFSSDQILTAATQEEPPFARRVIKSTIINDFPIKQMGLSVRASNCLQKAGIINVSEIINWNQYDFLKLRNMGKKSANEILHRIKELYDSGQILMAATEEELRIAKEDFFSSEEFRRSVVQAILMLLNDAGFHGIAIDEIIKKLSESADEEYLLPIIEDMLQEGSIICENGLYSKAFPSILDAIEVLPDDHQRYIRDRLEGKTLQEIGIYAGITKERVRQKISKDIRMLKEGSRRITPVYYFSEDAFQHMYENYNISRSEWLSIIGEPEYIFNYLQIAYQRGSKYLEMALDDPQVDEGIKLRIQARGDENYIVLGDKRILKARKEIEDYVICHFFKDEGSVDEFYDTYNTFLEECGIEDIRLFTRKEIIKSRENRLSESRKVLWKQNRRLRYYDIDGTDFEELFDTLDLHQYENVELSTYKFIRDYPELMDEYDIRDEYELHNLLKKICDQNEYPSIQFGRMPNIRFGQFNRDAAVQELLFDLAPISKDDLAEALCEKYGVKVDSIKANWLDCIEEYLVNGDYIVEQEEYQILTDDQLIQLNDLLSGDFYTADDVAEMYSRVTGAKRTPNRFDLKRMGFKVYSNYYFRGAETANEFFVNMLTSDDIVDLSSYGKKFRDLTTFAQVEYALRSEYEILEFEPYRFVNIRRLATFGMDKSDVIAYCNEVKKFVGEGEYFTIPWLRNQGFTSKLDDLGFEDFFYAAILAMDPGVYSFIQRSDKRKDSALLKVGKSRGSKSDFLVKLIEREGSIDKYELINYCRNNYGIEVTDTSIHRAVEDSDVYYDEIMEKYYANYSLYFDEI